MVLLLREYTTELFSSNPNFALILHGGRLHAITQNCKWPTRSVTDLKIQARTQPELETNFKIVNCPEKVRKLG